MADKQVKFVLDLDIKEFTEKGLQAKGIIESLSDKDNLEGLVEGLLNTTAVLGTVGLAAYAFKKAIDLTVEAEQIQKIEQQFNTLATQAGLSATELKDGMIEASKGLVTTDDLLKIANKAIISMGDSASKLPEIMELARKATSVFGGDVKTNFENLSTAISNGNVRALRQYGIHVDLNKAIKEYAQANGLAANELSEAGRRQAVMNAALEQGQKNFKNVNENLDSATSTLTLLKNTISETGEIFTLVFEKTVGPSIRNFLGGVQAMASDAKRALTSVFGEGMDQNKAQIEETEAKLMSLKGQLVDLEHSNGEQGFFDKLFKGKKENQIVKINQEIAATTQALEALRSKTSELRGEEEKKGSGINPRGPEDKANQEIRLANERKFQEQMTAIQKEALVAQQANVNSFADIETALKAQAVIEEQVHQQKLMEIRNASHLNESQKTKLIDAENKKYQQMSVVREQQLADERKKLLDQYQKNSTNAFDGIGRAFKVNAAKSTAELQDFGKQGQSIVNSFQSNATIAFTKVGEAAVQGGNVAQAAAKALGATILGTIGDKAIADGSYMMLSGIFPPNPASIAAGASLIALGGALKSVSSGMLSHMGPSSGGGGGGGISTSDPCPAIAKAKTCAGTADVTSPLDQAQSTNGSDTNAASAEPNMSSMERTQKSVNIQIAGNYFDTDTTRKQLMEMIRQETDATDFTYTKIGV